MNSWAPASLGLPRSGDMQERVWADLRAASKASLYFFAKGVLGFDRLRPHLHLPACNYLQLMPWNCVWPQSRMKALIMPRDHYKSTMASVALPMWVVTQDPNATCRIVSAVEDNSVGWLYAIRQVFKTNEKFRWLFPELLPDAAQRDSATAFTIRRPSDASPETQPTFRAASIISGQASKHVNYVFLDDLVNEMTVDSPRLVERAVTLYKLTESIMKDWTESALWLTGTPWGFADVLDYALQNEVADGTMMLWKIGCYGTFTTSPEISGNPRFSYTGNPGEAILPDRHPNEDLKRLEKKYGPFQFSCNYLCAIGASQVLMSDFSEKRIDEVVAGDEIVGYRFVSDTRTGGRAHFTRAKVRAVHSKHAHVVTIRFASGRSVTVTPDHQWYRYFKRNTKQPAYAALTLGDRVCRFARPIDYRGTAEEWGWLTGILDGEGWVGKDRTAIAICQSPMSNPEVCYRIEELLSKFGIEYSVSNSQGVNLYRPLGARALYLKFLKHHPAKAERLRAGLWQTSGFSARDTVVSIEAAGEAQVYALETETGNYILEGIASRNCNPFDDSQSGFRASALRYFRRRIDGLLACDCHPTHTHHLRDLVWGLALDPAFSDADTAAESAICVGGMASDGCRYLFHVWNGREDPSALWARIQDLVATYQPWLKRIGVEAVASQKLFAHWFRFMQKEQDALPGVRFVELIPDSHIQKEMRIRAEELPLTNGQWHISYGMDNFMGQFTKFPRVRPIDILDAWAYLRDVWDEGAPVAQLDVPPGVSWNQLQAELSRQRIPYAHRRN